MIVCHNSSGRIAWLNSKVLLQNAWCHIRLMKLDALPFLKRIKEIINFVTNKWFLLNYQKFRDSALKLLQLQVRGIFDVIVPKNNKIWYNLTSITCHICQINLPINQICQGTSVLEFEGHKTLHPRYKANPWGRAIREIHDWYHWTSLPCRCNEWLVWFQTSRMPWKHLLCRKEKKLFE